MRRIHYISLGFICCTAFGGSAWASSEEVFIQSNAVGSAGWNLGYGEAADEEEREAKSRAEAEREKRKKEQKARRKQNKKEDFFNRSIDVYDEDLGSLEGRE